MEKKKKNLMSLKLKNNYKSACRGDSTQLSENNTTRKKLLILKHPCVSFICDISSSPAGITDLLKGYINTTLILKIMKIENP